MRLHAQLVMVNQMINSNLKVKNNKLFHKNHSLNKYLINNNKMIKNYKVNQLFQQQIHKYRIYIMNKKILIQTNNK